MHSRRQRHCRYPLLPNVDRGFTFALRRPHSRLLSGSSALSHGGSIDHCQSLPSAHTPPGGAQPPPFSPLHLCCQHTSPSPFRALSLCVSVHNLAVATQVVCKVVVQRKAQGPCRTCNESKEEEGLGVFADNIALGRQVFLLTNSLWEYTNVVMNHINGNSLHPTP